MAINPTYFFSGMLKRVCIKLPSVSKYLPFQVFVAYQTKMGGSPQPPLAYALGRKYKDNGFG